MVRFIVNSMMKCWVGRMVDGVPISPSGRFAAAGSREVSKKLQEHKWIHLVGDTKSYIELCRDIAKLTSSGGRPYCGEGGFIFGFNPSLPLLAWFAR